MFSSWIWTLTEPRMQKNAEMSQDAEDTSTCSVFAGCDSLEHNMNNESVTAAERYHTPAYQQGTLYCVPYKIAVAHGGKLTVFIMVSTSDVVSVSRRSQDVFWNVSVSSSRSQEFGKIECLGLEDITSWSRVS